MGARIIVPVDNQECTYAAIETIKAREWVGDPELLLVKVVENLASVLNGNPSVHKDVLRSEQESYTYEMSLWLTELTAELQKSFPSAHCLLETGDVAARIGEIAFQWGADLIIIGSHDLELSTRCALGSVAGEIVRNAPCSVEIVRSRRLREIIHRTGTVTPDDIRNAIVPPRRLLLATDFSRDAETAVEWLTGIDWPAVSAVRLVSVVTPEFKSPGAHWFGGPETVFTKERRHQKTLQEQLVVHAKTVADALSFGKVETELVISEEPVEEIVKRANEWGANLVITGAGGGRGDSGGELAGPTACGVLEGVHCSMAIIHSLPSDPDRRVRYSWNKQRL